MRTRGGQLNWQSRQQLIIDPWHWLTLTVKNFFLCMRVSRCTIAGTHCTCCSYQPILPLWTKSCSGKIASFQFQAQADNEFYFLHFQRRPMLPRPLCLCLCLHVTVHVLIQGFCPRRSALHSLQHNLMSRFLPIRVYWRYSLWVQQAVWHQRNSPKPVVSFFTQPHREERGREGEEKYFLYSKGRLGIQGMVSYLGYCLN